MALVDEPIAGDRGTPDRRMVCSSQKKGPHNETNARPFGQLISSPIARHKVAAVAIRIVDFTSNSALPITQFSSSGASSVELAHGVGESHAYAVHFVPGGVIGPHPAGYDQLFLVVHGSGWIAGADGVRLELGANHGAFVPKGELHSKGSEGGLLALMVQASAFTLPNSS